MSIRSFVKIGPTSSKTAVGVNFNEVRKSINRQGMVLTDIGKNLQQIATIAKFQQDFLNNSAKTRINKIKDDAKKEKTFKAQAKARLGRMSKKDRRDAAENAAEKGATKAANLNNKKERDAIAKPVKGFLGKVLGTLGKIIETFVLFGALDWISKNPEKVQKVMEVMFAIGKFAFKLIGMGVGATLDLITNMFGSNPTATETEKKFKGLTGLVALIGGLAALKAAPGIAKDLKTLSDKRKIDNAVKQTQEIRKERTTARKARITGYRDKKTGVVYTKDEYERMQRAARRKGREGAFNDRFVTQQRSLQQKGPLAKMRQRGRIMSTKIGRNPLAKRALGGARAGGGLSVLGGAARIATGIASGEDVGTATTVGVAQAAGGIAGAAALTAVAPFLGPLAPMIGSAIGSFLGEWVGKEMAPIIEPIFEPIGRFFKMSWEIIQGVWSNIDGPLMDLFGDVFELVGQIGDVMQGAGKVFKDFGEFVFGPVFSRIGAVIGFIVDKVKFFLDPTGAIGAGLNSAKEATTQFVAEKTKDWSWGGVADFFTMGATDFDGKSRGGGNNTQGAIKGLTDNDYRELAFIVSKEAARNTDDEYGVAAAVLNRVANPAWPNTIKEVGAQEGQFEAVFKGMAYYDDELAQKLKNNPGKIREALRKLNGRDSFKGQTMLKYKGNGDIMFAESGNFFHYRQQHGTADPPPNDPDQGWKRYLAAGGKVLGNVPYLNQRANKQDKFGRPGDTQCYSTTMAMWASYLLGQDMSSEDYNQVRQKHGSSTLHSVQANALRDLGINSRLETGNLGYGMLKKEIDAGYPVPLGFKYKGSGHWGMLVGYDSDNWIVHDPFGQLGMGGNWLRTNSSQDKRGGPGKFYKMSKKIFNNQMPSNDMFIWRAPRSINPNPNFEKPSASESGQSAPQQSTYGPGSEATERDSATGVKMTLDTVESIQEAFKKMLTTGLEHVGTAASSMGATAPGPEPAEGTAHKLTQVMKTLQTKAQKDSDAEMTAPTVIVNNTTTQQVINKQGGKPVPIRTSPSPMLTK